MIRRSIPLLLGAVLLAGTATARAQDKSDPAWVYFNAGQQAYAAGKYPQAIQAFEKAYKLVAKPGLIFSIAQAYRKHYVAEKNARDLRKAVEHYRKYLELVPEGGRRADAVSALEELEPQLARLAEEAPEASAQAPEPTKAGLMITTAVKAAKITVDGGAPGETPHTVDVKPGPHTVRITADGYFPLEREVPVPEGDVIAIDFQLQEMPATLEIQGTSGAEVSVDGRPMGELPLSRPLELPAGSRFVTVTRNGYKPFSQEISLKRGEKRRVVADIETTKQRVLSYIFMGAGAVSAGAGLLAALGAGAAQVEAEEIESRRQGSSITEDELESYEKAVRARDQLRGAAIGSFAGAALFGGTGFLLFFFDQPTISAPPPRVGQGPGAPAARASSTSTDRLLGLSAAPIWAPGVVGGTIRGRF